MHTYLKKNNNFRLQGLQIEAFQQRFLKCYCETPFLEDEGSKNPQKLKNVLQQYFPEWFWSPNYRTYIILGRLNEKIS